MKRPKVKLNIRITLAIFIVLFSILGIYTAYSVSVYGDAWFATPYNPRINAAKDSIEAGTIYDRNGVVLANSEGTDRHYSSDKTLRKAVSHVVGDESGITLGAETVFSKYLYGFDEGVINKMKNAVRDEDKLRGNDITLTIDADLSRYIYENMDYRGAAVIMNYKTGEVLASVSSPAFDPESIKDTSEGSEYVNRATMGRYAPGSTMKVLTAAAAIEKGIDFTYECKGVEYIDGKKITCVEDHGTQNLEEAFANSCNTYFAMLSQKLGHEDLERWADLGMYDHEFVFTDMTLYPGHYELSSYAPDTAWAAIGQYKDLVTPMQNCMIAAAIANDGRMLEPKLLKSIDGTIYAPSVNVISSMPSDITDRVRDFMRKTVEEGTATNAQISGYDVCGKTGTAEYNDGGEKKNHSWFIGFIDDDQHPLAVSIILEGAGYGSKYATPLAKKALSYALDKGY